MSASEVASNPFWYVNSTAALSSRDRLSIFVLAMCISPSTNLDMMGTGKPVKSAAFIWPATIPDPDVPDRAFEWGHVARSSIGPRVIARESTGPDAVGGSSVLLLEAPELTGHFPRSARVSLALCRHRQTVRSP